MRRPIIALQLLSYFVFFIVIRVVLEIESNWYFDITAGILFIISLTAVFYKKNILLFYLNMLIFTYLFAYFLQFKIGASFLTRPHLKNEFGLAAAAVIITHVSFLFPAYMLAARRTLRELTAPFPPNRRMMQIGLVCVATILVAFIAYFGWNSLVGSRVENQAAFAGRPGYEVFLLYAIKALPYFLLLAMIDYMLAAGRRPAFVAVIAAVALFAIYFSNPSNTPRFICLGAMGVILVYAITRGRYLSLSMFVAATPYIFPVLLPVTSLMRRPDYDFTVENWAQSFSSLEFSAIQLFVDGLETIRNTTCCGNKVLSAIFILIPRGLWPAKSTGTGVELAEANFYVLTNVAVPSFFDFYADYGFFGLAILSLGMGYLLGRCELPGGVRISFYNRNAMYSVMIFCLVPILVRGDLSTFFVSFYAFAVAYEAVRFLTSGRLVSISRISQSSYPSATIPSPQ